MNYYNPYTFYPFMTASAQPISGIMSNSVGKSFSFSSLLNGAQKTLNFVNQAIPVVKQVSPVMKNAKTMFRVLNEFKKVDSNSSNIENQPISKAKSNFESKESSIVTNNVLSNNQGPTFFI